MFKHNETSAKLLNEATKTENKCLNERADVSLHHSEFKDIGLTVIHI